MSLSPAVLRGGRCRCIGRRSSGSGNCAAARAARRIPRPDTTTAAGGGCRVGRRDFSALKSTADRRRTVVAAAALAPPRSSSTLLHGRWLGRSASSTIAQATAPTTTSATASSSSSSNSSSSQNNNGRSASFFSDNRRSQMAALALSSLAIGFGLGRISVPDESPKDPIRVLPNGLPRACCDKFKEIKPQHQELVRKLQTIVGTENVLDGGVDTTATLPFLKGARLGHGHALCIVTPRRLVEVVDCVQAIVDADCILVPQGQNTGLTGGSVPHLNGSDEEEDRRRPTVLLSMKYLDRMFPIDDGKRVVCLAGVGLASLSQFLEEYFPDRESHSQLGSTFLNPTTAAGIAFGSGGTQLRKGPAYTERALYLKVHTNKWNEKIVQVVNTLGIQGMDDKHLPEGRARKVMDSVAYRLDTWSRWIEERYARDMRYSTDEGKSLAASDAQYKRRVCRCRAEDGDSGDEVARYNADTRGPDLNRSEGKVVILATVHDTFPKPIRTKTFWISFDSLGTALEFRKEVCLDNPRDLPISLEYMDRDAYDVVDRAGRVSAHAINLFGTTSSVVRRFWRAKLWLEALPVAGAPLVVDRFLYRINDLFPSVLPGDVAETAKAFDHHVAMTVGDFDNDDGDEGGSHDGSNNGSNIERLLDRLQQFASKHGRDKIVIHDCSNKPAALSAFRFVAATAFRTWCVGQPQGGVQGISVDYALPKNDGTPPSFGGTDRPPSPSDTAAAAASAASAVPLKRMRYSHFGCNVVHEDLAYGPDVDVHKAKYAIKAAVEHQCHGKLPAEHGHGTEYVAPKETQERWKRMDPLNVLNPGIGGLSTKPKYID